eukprot:scaffold70309_cov32-Tisochrysis_lutea.AAC.6
MSVAGCARRGRRLSDLWGVPVDDTRQPSRGSETTWFIYCHFLFSYLRFKTETFGGESYFMIVGTLGCCPVAEDRYQITMEDGRPGYVILSKSKRSISIMKSAQSARVRVSPVAGERSCESASAVGHGIEVPRLKVVEPPQHGCPGCREQGMRMCWCW